MRISDWSSDVCSSDLIGDDPNSDDRWQQHQLALLLSDDGRHYDPTFLADAADKILFSNTDVNWASLGTPDHQYAYDGYRSAPLAIGPDLWEAPALASKELIAMRAPADHEDAPYAALPNPAERREGEESV